MRFGIKTVSTALQCKIEDIDKKKYIFFYQVTYLESYYRGIYIQNKPLANGDPFAIVLITISTVSLYDVSSIKCSGIS